MKATWYNLDGREIEGSDNFEMKEKSLSDAMEVIVKKYNFRPITISINWVLMGDDKRRLLLSAV